MTNPVQCAETSKRADEMECTWSELQQAEIVEMQPVSIRFRWNELT